MLVMLVMLLLQLLACSVDGLVCPECSWHLSASAPGVRGSGKPVSYIYSCRFIFTRIHVPRTVQCGRIYSTFSTPEGPSNPRALRPR